MTNYIPLAAVQNNVLDSAPTYTHISGHAVSPLAQAFASLASASEIQNFTAAVNAGKTSGYSRA